MFDKFDKDIICDAPLTCRSFNNISLSYNLVATILAKVMKFVDAPVNENDIPMDGSGVGPNVINVVNTFLAKVNADRLLPKL